MRRPAVAKTAQLSARLWRETGVIRLCASAHYCRGPRRVSDGSTGARILAGGQSLVPMLNLRLSSATLLVDIRQISELRQATESVDTVIFGACVRHAEIEDGVVPDPAIGMMRHVARHLAYRAVRNRGTIGGSVALADPCG